jgi:hypothetical protein
MDILTHVLMNGGGTFDLLDGTPVPITGASGFVVGQAKGTPVTISLSTSTNLRPIADLLVSSLKYVADGWRTSLVGAWVKDTILYIDPVTIWYNEDNARYDARRYDQEAIFNLTTKEVIYVR